MLVDCGVDMFFEASDCFRSERAQVFSIFVCNRGFMSLQIGELMPWVGSGRCVSRRFSGGRRRIRGKTLRNISGRGSRIISASNSRILRRSGFGINGTGSRSDSCRLANVFHG